MLNIQNPCEFSRSSPSCLWPSSKTAAPPLSLDSLLTLTAAEQDTREIKTEFSQSLIGVISNDLLLKPLPLLDTDSSAVTCTVHE